MSLCCTARPAQIATAKGKLEKRATEGRRYWSCIQQLKVSGNFVLYFYDLCCLPPYIRSANESAEVIRKLYILSVERSIYELER